MTCLVAGNTDVSRWEALLRRLLRPLTVAAWAVVVATNPSASGATPAPAILKPDLLRRHVESFNCHDHTHFGQAVPNEETADGFVVTEFLPKVPWSGEHNNISCPAQRQVAGTHG